MPDFFVLSKVVPLLLFPLPLVLVAIFALSWAMKRGVARWLVRIAVAMLWLCSTPWFADSLSQAWEAPRIATDKLPAVSDVAVVLGGLSDPKISTPDHLEFNRAAERITEAVALWKQGRVKALLITSGSGDLYDPSAVEAPGLAAWARSMGVPAEAVLTESASRNTFENADKSLALAQTKGFHTFVLVTSAVHMPRSAAIFRKAGYASQGRSLALWPVDTQRNRVPFPFNAVPDPNSLTTVQAVIREAVGYLVYQIQGYL